MMPFAKFNQGMANDGCDVASSMVYNQVRNRCMQHTVSPWRRKICCCTGFFGLSVTLCECAHGKRCAAAAADAVQSCVESYMEDAGLPSGADVATALGYKPEMITYQTSTVTGCTAHGGGWVWVIVVAASALTVGAAVVHCRCKVADAKPQQDEESVARDSTAETATLAGKSMKQASDTSYP